MNGWKIVRIPTVSKLTNECFDLYSSMRNVLYATYNVAGNSSSIEIVSRTRSKEKYQFISSPILQERLTASTLSHSISLQLLTNLKYWIPMLSK